MSLDQRWDMALHHASQSLSGMNPESIELAFAELRALWDETAGSHRGRMKLERVRSLRMTRAAAVRAAQLWRGCIPQPGYGAAAHVEHETTRSELSVTG